MANGIMYVDNIRVEFDDSHKSVLEVCQKAGVEMPNFCFHSDLSVYGACRMCMVEDDKGGIEAACQMAPRDGLRIRTNTSRLLRYRRTILELILAAHCRDCTTCPKNGDCRLQNMAVRFGIHDIRFDDTRPKYEEDHSSKAISVDMSKCILCGDCVRVCEEMQGMSILRFVGRGPNLRIATAGDAKLSATHCVSCGQCSAVCTTGAITVKNEIGLAWKALHDPTKRVVVQIAPAVRVALGEAYRIPPGQNVLDQLVSALKIMGADEVYDTIFGADLTVREEGDEFMRRLESGENLPLMTSCCPAWVRYVEQERPQFLKNLSSALSPMQMFATVLKDRYAKKDSEDGRKTFHIAIMPCTAKKMEAARPEFSRDGVPNVDLVLTTQEVIRMMEESGILFEQLEKESPDLPYGMGSGAAEIFGSTGGVAEAVVRHCLPDKSKNALRMIEHSGLRGTDPIRFATVKIGERDVRVAVVNGLGNAKTLLDQIESGEVQVDIVEVMSCRSGCVGGAGQPYALMSTKLKRAAGLYEIDKSAMFKRSERNPVLNTMYAEDLTERRHELLHHSYAGEGHEEASGK
ncbi:MAG: (2Fe-2S)-binding protein [Oscillospiraceae bacterium]|nr:(2Fe-2S)-binding protein [Oscillospiraceae bacterium]